MHGKQPFRKSEQLGRLASTARALANSVMAHPDCEKGSEFADFLEELLKELKHFEQQD